MGNSNSQTKSQYYKGTKGGGVYCDVEIQKSKQDICNNSNTRIQIAREMKIKRKRGIKVEIGNSIGSPNSIIAIPEASVRTPEKVQQERKTLSSVPSSPQDDKHRSTNRPTESSQVGSSEDIEQHATSNRNKEGDEESPKSVAVDTSFVMEQGLVPSKLDLLSFEAEAKADHTTTNHVTNLHKPTYSLSSSKNESEHLDIERIAQDLHAGFIALEHEWKKSSVIETTNAVSVSPSTPGILCDESGEDEMSFTSIREDDESLTDFDRPERCEELDDLNRLVEELESNNNSSKSLFEITPILEEHEDESDDDEKSNVDVFGDRDDSKRVIHDLHAGFTALEQEWKQCSVVTLPVSPPKPRRLFDVGHEEEKGDDELSFGSAGDMMKQTERTKDLDPVEKVDERDLDLEFEKMMHELEKEEGQEENLEPTNNRNIKVDDDSENDCEQDDKSIESDAMFSQSDSSEYQSLGPNSASGISMGFSASDFTITSYAADFIAARTQNRPGGLSNGPQPNSFKTLASVKPTASNAFETLPRHLIKTSLLQQAVSTLRDERFLTRRIIKLGAVYAAKIHVLDFVCMDHKIMKDIKKIEAERTSLEASMPTTAYFANGEDFESVAIDSFEIFEKCILELCGIQMVGFDDIDVNGVEKHLEENFADSKSHSTSVRTDNETQTPVSKIPEPNISLSDGGRALYTIGKYCQKLDWNQDAMQFYKHALYLCLLNVGVEEPRLLDNSDDCDGFFYVQVAREYVHDASDTHQYLAAILQKMGDIHGKCGEKNDALRAYKASEVFLRKYISDLELVNADDSYKRAAIEALALSFNRVGSVYTAKGELDAALSSFHDALDIQRKTLGEDHVEVAKTLHNIGVCHRHNDDWDSALKYYIQAHRIFEKTLGRDHLDTVRTLHNIGGVYRRQREYAKAMECFKEVLVVRRNSLGDDHPSVSITLVSMAAVLRRCGKTKEANKFYAAAVH